MPQKDMSNFGGMVADLYREMSFSVFFCTVGGMVLGAFLTVCVLIFWLVAMASLVPPPTQPAPVYGGNPRQPAYGTPVNTTAPQGNVRAMPVLCLLVIPGMIAGGTIGCLFGVILDFAVNLLRGPQPKDTKRRGKKWVPERDAPRRSPRHTTEDDPGGIDSHWKRNDDDKLQPDR